MSPTWEDEEDARHKCQDGALGPDVSDVTDDESSEDEEQRHHGEGCSCTHHLCRKRRHGVKLTDRLCPSTEMKIYKNYTWTFHSDSWLKVSSLYGQHSYLEKNIWLARIYKSD